MSYTKGEWRHEIEKDGININDVIKHNNQYVATIHVTGPDSEWKSNAKLIAAAPNLLEALSNLLDSIPKQDNDHDWWPDELTHAVEAAEKAITKATE